MVWVKDYPRPSPYSVCPPLFPREYSDCRSPETAVILNMLAWVAVKLQTNLLSIFFPVHIIDIASALGSRSCVSCRKSSAHCNKITGVCNSNCGRTKLCRRADDLCLATWRWKGQKLLMFTSCFPLPPFSNSSHYQAKCESKILHGTRTCLCQGSNCNRNPIEPVRDNAKQAFGRAKPKVLRQTSEYKFFWSNCTFLQSFLLVERKLYG